MTETAQNSPFRAGWSDALVPLAQLWLGRLVIWRLSFLSRAPEPESSRCFPLRLALFAPFGIWDGRKRGGRGRRTNQTRTNAETWPTRCSFWAPPTHPSPNAWAGKRGTKGLGDGIGKGMFFNECGFLLVSWEISRLRGAAG